MCCQKVAEAEAMVEGGVADVLVSNEVVGAKKLERLAALSRRAKVGVCVDNAENVAQLKGDLDVYIELEVGMRRCGVEPGEAVVDLATKILKAKLRFAGLQAYHGRAQHMRSMEERHAAIETAAQHVQHTKRLLAKAGFPVRPSPARAAAPTCWKSRPAPGTRSSPAPTPSWTRTTRRTSGRRRCRVSSTRCSFSPR